MEKKEKQSSGGQLLPILLACMLLACAGFVFAIYTHRELSWLKTQIHEHEKLIQTLHLGKNARDIQVGDSLSYLQASVILWKAFDIYTVIPLEESFNGFFY